MKNYLAFLLVGISFSLIAQEPILISGEVSDKATNEVIPYVNIYVEGKAVGTSTNSKGEFQIRLPRNFKNEKLIISYIGYKSQSIQLTNVADGLIKIFLEADRILLSEVKVTPENALAIIYEAIEKIPVNYNLNNHSVTGFQREIVSDDGNFIQILEADFVSRRDGDKTTSTLVGGKYAEDKLRRENDNLWKDKRGGFYTFGFTGLSGMVVPAQDSFLGIEFEKEKDFNNYYDFTLDGTVSFADMELYVIRFDQKNHVEKALVKGTLYIDRESKAFVKLSYSLSPKGLKYIKTNQTWEGKPVSTASGAKKIQLQNERYQYSYRRFGSKWYLDNYIMEAVFDASLKMALITLAKKENMHYRSERVITTIDTVSIPKTPPTIAPSDFYYFQVFMKNNYENYDPSDWEKFTSLKSDTSYAEVVEQFRLNNNLRIKKNN